MTARFPTENERDNMMRKRVKESLKKLAGRGLAFDGVWIEGRKVHCPWRSVKVGASANPHTIAKIMALSTGRCPSGSTFDRIEFRANLKLLGYVFKRGRVERL